MISNSILSETINELNIFIGTEFKVTGNIYTNTASIIRLNKIMTFQII